MTKTPAPKAPAKKAAVKKLASSAPAAQSVKPAAKLSDNAGVVKLADKPVAKPAPKPVAAAKPAAKTSARPVAAPAPRPLAVASPVTTMKPVYPPTPPTCCTRRGARPGEETFAPCCEVRGSCRAGPVAAAHLTVRRPLCTAPAPDPSDEQPRTRHAAPRPQV